MARYRIDARLTVRVADLEVEIDDDDPRPHVVKLMEAAGAVVNERLTMLDIKGARGGNVISHGVETVNNWDRID